jgi:uncharacterized cupredoxin-like copper-binding protein
MSVAGQTEAAGRAYHRPMAKVHRLPLVGAVVVVVAGLTGCGGGSGNSSNAAASRASGTTSSSSSSGGSAVKTITVSETEYKLSPSTVSIAKPGTYEFKAVNNGSVAHALEIEGTGVEEETSHISPGDSATVKVTFKGAGSYEMYCPVDGHKDQGMEGKITIGSAAAGQGGTTTNGDTMHGDTNETETGDTSTTKSGGYGY